MKRIHLLTLLLLGCFSGLMAQDYKVVSIDYLQGDMTARKTIFTEKVDGGQQCAVLRISTQNILDRDRDAFQFECDMGSVIRERRKDGGEICLWVSPGIKILKIKHAQLGNYVLNIPDVLHSDVQSLNTYLVSIVGLKELPPDPSPIGSSNLVFMPYPEDAVLYLNGDSIGAGTQQLRSFSGSYNWKVRRDLYQEETGTLILRQKETDTLSVILTPIYGYLNIAEDSVFTETMTVLLNGEQVGTVPFQSARLAPGSYVVQLKKGSEHFLRRNVVIKPRQILTVTTKELVAGGIIGDYQPLTGKLTINSNPDEANVFLDGQSMGITPLYLADLEIGPHNIRLTKAGCTAVEQMIDVREGKERKLTLNLPTACSVTFTTDTSGDDIYVDGIYVGKSPLVTDVSFGEHVFKAIRDGHAIETKMTLSRREVKKTVMINFGQLVRVETDSPRDKIYVDGKKQGKAPTDVYLSNGQHTLRAAHGWKLGEKTVEVNDSEMLGNVFIDTHYDKPSHYVRSGVFFVTADMARVSKEHTAIGLSLGSMHESGWFLSFITGTTYDGYDAKLSADANGIIDGVQPHYSGEKTYVRGSITLGALMRIAGPVYLKAGAGYGIRNLNWKIADTNEWAVIKPYSWQNVEASLGLQVCIYSFVLHADFLAPLDMVTGDRKAYEIRVGFGTSFKYR